jgi:AcrR family transcriptional regulator
VSHAAPYNHFADKAALLCAVAEEGFRNLQAAMVEATGRPGLSPVDQLCEVGVAYVLFAANHPAHFRVMFSPEVAGAKASPALQTLGRATFAQLLQGIERAGPLSPETALDGALTAWAAVHGIAMLSIDGQLAWVEAGADRVEALAARVTRVLTKGLRDRARQDGGGADPRGEGPSAL